MSLRDSCSGIRSVVWSVSAPGDPARSTGGMYVAGPDGSLAGTDSAGQPLDADQLREVRIAGKDANLLTEMGFTIPVCADDDGIVVSVTMTDGAGHISDGMLTLSVDHAAPIVDISFSDGDKSGRSAPQDAFGRQYFAHARTAVIHVRDRNFDPEAVAVVTHNAYGRTPEPTEWKYLAQENLWESRVTFEADGSYTLRVTARDLAGNVAQPAEEAPFVIDRTAPAVNIRMSGSPRSGSWYGQSRTAEITVTERNFDPAQVHLDGRTDAAGGTFPSVSGWREDGITHTAEITFAADGRYALDLAVADLAGNTADAKMPAFILDATAPEIMIEGVADHSANRGTVAPVIRLRDASFDATQTSLELRGANRGRVEPDGSWMRTADGMIFTFRDFGHTRQMDDVYTLTVRQADLAGNVAAKEITFSVNRFGSVFAMDERTMEYQGKFLREPAKVRFFETNIDRVNPDDVRVTVSCDGRPRDLIQGRDYSVRETGGAGSWHRYLYELAAGNFAQDARYDVMIATRDAAGNENSTISSEPKAQLTFAVDSTAPVVRALNIRDGQTFDGSAQDAAFLVSDNLLLESAEATLDGEPVELVQDETGSIYHLHIPASKASRRIVVSASDAAGNRSEITVRRVLVTTDHRAQAVHRMPTAAGLLAAVSAAAALAWIAVVKYRGRNGKRQDRS